VSHVGWLPGQNPRRRRTAGPGPRSAREPPRLPAGPRARGRNRRRAWRTSASRARGFRMRRTGRPPAPATRSARGSSVSTRFRRRVPSSRKPSKKTSRTSPPLSPKSSYTAGGEVSALCATRRVVSPETPSWVRVFQRCPDQAVPQLRRSLFRPGHKPVLRIEPRPRQSRPGSRSARSFWRAVWSPDGPPYRVGSSPRRHPWQRW